MAKNYTSPKGRVSDKVYTKTLKEVNKILRANGKPVLKNLPSGIPGSKCNCPLSRALRPIGVTQVFGSSMSLDLKGVSVFNKYGVGTKWKAVSIEGPDVFDDFVEEFDGQ